METVQGPNKGVYIYPCVPMCVRAYVYNKFMYVSNPLPRSVNEEVNTHIAEGSSAFGRLGESLWERRAI